MAVAVGIQEGDVLFLGTGDTEAEAMGGLASLLGNDVLGRVEDARGRLRSPQSPSGGISWGNDDCRTDQCDCPEDVTQATKVEGQGASGPGAVASETARQCVICDAEVPEALSFYTQSRYGEDRCKGHAFG